VYPKFLVLFILFLAGCALKEPPKQEVFLLIHTPQLRYGDVAFLQRSQEAVDLELYEAGQPLFRLHVEPERVCLDGRCMEASLFARRFLAPAYPSTFLWNLLQKRPIFDGQGLIFREDGFIQRIHTPRLDIIYEVSSRSISFKDRRNGIRILIKEFHG